MGVSTDAILFYGYCWDDEAVDLGKLDAANELECFDDWVEHVLADRGVSNPWDAYPEEELSKLPYSERQRHGDAWCEANKTAIEHRRRAEKVVREDMAVELLSHGSGDYAMPYLSAWKIVARLGHPRVAELPAVDPVWREKLDAWLAYFEIEPPQDVPRFWLVSERS